MSAMDNDSD